MSQSWCCAGCGTWNWGSRSSCHYCGQALRTSNGNSWVQVAKKGKTSGKGRGVHIKQQYNGAQNVQIASVSKALTELEASEDRELMQPLESRLAELKSRLHGARPMGQQVDGLRGVISRCQKRLAEAETAKADAEAAILKETEDIANYRAQLAELEPLLTTPMGFRKADEPNNGAVINSQTHVGKQQHRQRGCGAIASWIDGTSPPAYTARRTADWTRRTAL